jgi:hypothetical protein
MNFVKLDLRTADLARRHFGGVASRVWLILRTLFHEVMGVLFLAMAGWGALWMLRTWRSFDGGAEDLFRMVLVGAFVLMMGGFGLSSFWRARRIARGK